MQFRAWMFSACGFWLFRRGSLSWCSQISRSLLWLLSRFVFVLISLFYLSFSKGLIYFSWVAYVVDECMFLPRFKSVAKFRLWFSYSPLKGLLTIFEWQFLINRCKMYSSLTAVIAIEFLDNFWHKIFGELGYLCKCCSRPVCHKPQSNLTIGFLSTTNGKILKRAHQI